VVGGKRGGCLKMIRGESGEGEGRDSERFL